VAEAGGRVEGLAGRPPGPDFALAAPPDLFERLHALLLPLDPARD
jgi:myo-inositol-1(or 4)-monophosphatase